MLNDYLNTNGHLQKVALVLEIYLFKFQIPCYAFYLLWVNLLGPWFSAGTPEMDDKQTKKMERKTRRQFVYK